MSGLWWAVLGVLVGAGVLFGLVYWRPHLRFTRAGAAIIFTTHSFGAGPVRVLSVGGGWQSGMLLANPNELVFPYVKAFDAIFCGPAAVRRALCLGGGGFSYPRSLAARGVAVDAVEIDPRVIRIAQRFFGLSEALELQDARGEPLLRVIEGDGLAYLRQTSARYDAIIIDAYAGMEAEAALGGAEAFNLAKAHLTFQGALAINVVTPYRNPAKLVACANALRSVFEHVYIISCTPGGEYQSKNHVVVGSNVAYELPQATKV